MKCCLWILLLGLGLTACNNDNKDQQETVEKPDLAPGLALGTYIVSVETDQELPMVGKYYSGGDGGKLLVLDDEQDRAKIVMHYDVQSKSWQSNQADKNFKVQFAHYEKIADQKLNLNQLMGTYTLSFADGSMIPVEVKAQGQIISKDQNCMFSGVMSESLLANTATYQLTDNKCEAMKNNVKGYVVMDQDLEPAGFRLLSDTVGSKDIWALAES